MTASMFYIYDRAKLISALKAIGASDEARLSLILDKCGVEIADKYVILDTTLDEGNPFYTAPELIDSAFDIDTSIDVFLQAKDGIDVGKVEGINYVDADTEMEAIDSHG